MPAQHGRISGRQDLDDEVAEQIGSCAAEGEEEKVVRCVSGEEGVRERGVEECR